MNLAVIDTKTHRVAVFDGRKKLTVVTFSRALFQDEVEGIRKDPTAFLAVLSSDEPTSAPEMA